MFQELPRKLQILKSSSAVNSTEFIGVIDEDGCVGGAGLRLF